MSAKEQTPTCNLCAQGFPLNGYIHYGTQALGMIPDTRCKSRLPLTELPWGTLDGRGSLVHIEGPDGEAVCSIPKGRRELADHIVKTHNDSLCQKAMP